MNLEDIIGPVMIGPSSSHTAGAVRIGLAGRRLLGEEIAEAEILLHGSFLATGKGHGTDLAIIAGLLGFAVEDERIRAAYSYAQKAGLRYTIAGIDLGEKVHPNTVKLLLTGKSGKSLELVASSIGGGRVQIVEKDRKSVSLDEAGEPIDGDWKNAYIGKRG